MMLFSATYDSQVMDFAENIVPNPGISRSEITFVNNVIQVESTDHFYDERS